MDSKTNEGYLIIDSITVGEITFVLGFRETAPPKFVTWQCKNSDYFWGHYFSNRLSATKDLCGRAMDATIYLESVKKDVTNMQKKAKSMDFER